MRMATLAIRSRQGLVVARKAELAALIVGLVGLGLGLTGSSWDVAWHRALGRDTFWSPPHVLMYVGTMLVGVSALIALAAAMRGRAPATTELRVGPLHVERGLAMVGFGALVIIAAAPIDDLWHNLFGRDVDIWSPPHLVAVAGAVLAYSGLAAAVASGFTGMMGRVRDVLVALLLGGLVYDLVFGMNFYYIFAWSREAFVYPLVVAAMIPFALAMGVTLIGGPLGATVTAVAYTLLNVAVFVVLRVLDWPEPAFAPLFIAGAVAADLVRARTRSAALIATAFVVAFVAAEGLRLAIAHPLPSAAVLTDRTVGHLATQYWQMALARPWLSIWPLLAVAIAIPLAASSYAVGHRVSAWLTTPRG